MKKHRVEVHKSKWATTPYVVHVPRRLEGGKQARRFFQTKAEARDFADDCEAKLARLGEGIWEDLTPIEIADVTEYAKKVRERRGVEKETALSAVEKFHGAQKESGASVKYLEQIRYEGRKFAAKFGDQFLGAITRAEILAWLQSFKGLSPTSRHATFRIASAIFGYGVTMGWVGVSPCAGLARRLGKAEAPKHILRPNDIQTLLATADLEVMHPWICLGAFAGLRPVEVTRLHWEDIDWARGQVFVRPEVAKQTKQHRTEGRFVTITDALRAWMLETAQKSGPIIPVADSALKRAKRAMTKKAGVTIPHDALRHSFASYHYALFNDAALTAKELGHTTTAMTFRAYARRDVAKEDAEAWFGLRPQRKARNVIPMRKAG